MCGDLRIIRARADCRRVAGAHRDANLGKRLAGGLEPLAQLGERPLEISLDVVVQRLERRDVEDVHRVGERLVAAVDDQLVQLPEKRRERLARCRSGARMSVCSPLAIAGQPSRCGALGAPSVSRNHSRTIG